MSSESIKVLQLRWIESAQAMYNAVDEDLNAKHKLDELVLVHIEMVKQFTDLTDQVEAELIKTTHTIKYMNEALSKLREDINNG